MMENNKLGLGIIATGLELEGNDMNKFVSYSLSTHNWAVFTRFLKKLRLQIL